MVVARDLAHPGAVVLASHEEGKVVPLPAKTRISS